MKRLTMTDLESLAFNNPGSEIETDEQGGIAVLAVGRRVYYAHLPERAPEFVRLVRGDVDRGRR